MLRIFRGLRGECPCCGEPTNIRIGSIGKTPKDSSWIVPEDVLRHIYQSVFSLVRKNKFKMYTKDPHPHNPTIRKKLYFICYSDGELSSPFSRPGLESALNAMGCTTDYPNLYVVDTSDRALKLLSDSPLISPQFNNCSAPSDRTEIDLF
jgi:hypothetical protein